MNAKVERIKKEVAKGENFHLTFFYWKTQTSVELGRCVIPKREELGQHTISVTSSLPSYVLQRIRESLLLEMAEKGLLKEGSDYGIEDFVKEYNLKIKRNSSTPIFGTSSFAVEWIDLT